MIKSKPCTVDGCSSPRFAKGYCKRHQSLRTDKKPVGIRKISEKGKIKKDLKKELVKNDMSFYLLEVWDKREHRCFETGKPLGPKPLITMFHHVLPKQTYPEFRHCEWNIVLLSPEIHNQVETDISKCPRVKELTTKLKEYALHRQTKSPGVLEEKIQESSNQRETEELDIIEGI